MVVMTRKPRTRKEVTTVEIPNGSRTLADLLAGHYDIGCFDHDVKVARISYCINLMDAMMKQGDLEHTNDWDWRIIVTTNDGAVHGTYDLPDDQYVWSDSMHLPYDAEPGDYLSRFARWNDLWITEFRGDEEVTVPIPIDSINHIVITEA